MKQFYTAKDLIKLLGFSKNTIYKYLEKGKIKSTRLSKRGGFRVPLKEVKRLLKLHGKEGEIDIGGKTRKKAAVESAEVAEESKGDKDSVSLLERVELESLKIQHPDHLPNLFDWFVGLLAIAVGFALFLFPGYFYQQKLFDLVGYFLSLRFFLLIGGLLFLLSDLLKLKSSVWHRILHFLLVLGFAVMAVLFVVGGEGRGAVLYGSVALVLTITAVVRGILPVYRFIWLVFFVSGVGSILWFLFPAWYGSVYSGALPTGVIAGVWLGVTGLIFGVSLTSVRRRSKWYRWASFLNGLVFLGYAFVMVIATYWDRAVAYILVGTFSFLFPFWERFRVAEKRGKEIEKRLFSFAYVGLVVVGGVFLTHVVRTQFKAFVSLGLEQRAQEVASRVGGFASQVQKEVESLAQNDLLLQALVEDDSVAIKDLVQGAFRSSDAARRIMVFDDSGNLLEIYPVPVPDIRGQNFAFREYFQKAKAGEVFVSDLFQAEVEGRPWAIAVSVPVYDFQERLVGVVVGAVNLDVLQELVEEIEVGEKGLVVLVDRTGRLIAHPDRERRFELLEDGQAGIMAIMGKRGVTEQFSAAHDGERVLTLAAFEPVEGFGWGVVVEQPLAEIGTVISSLSLFIFLMILVVSVVWMLGVNLQSERPKRLEGGRES